MYDCFDYPDKPHGSPDEKIDQLWEALFQLVEALNLKEDAK